MADWKAVAKVVNERMAELGLAEKRVSERSGLTIATLRKIRNADPQHRDVVTLTGLSRVLGLPEDHLERLAFGGGEKVTLSVGSAVLSERVAALEAELIALRARVAALESDARP
ncbi:hypothetical protein EDD29_1231 [Actinocorallia herbida]|uniref:HTH cro/C1-type domain-containing protein n=1 Tax=Actinocorallia herbida TaxID=58109 RepID=A0A3N1CRF0_9ACTN|nr:hypothetical protein [Actinocorallia herbida]ROO83724.1 hypothetical protein EDD29_1231 [Actinocorallia herbida]